MGNPPKDSVDDNLEKSRKLIDDMIDALKRYRLLLDHPVSATPPSDSDKKD
jgi:hypothetical protein